MSVRTVRCAGVDLPACIHPHGCDEPQDPNVYVCRWHMPSPFTSLTEVAARISEFRVAKRGNGYAVEHWTGCWLPIPTAVSSTEPTGTTSTGLWMVPRWAAEAALAAYARGEPPPIAHIREDGSMQWLAEPDEQPALFDVDGVAA